MDPMQPHHGPLCPACFADCQADNSRVHPIQSGESLERIEPAAIDAIDAMGGRAHRRSGTSKSHFRYPMQLHFEDSGVRLLCADIPEVNAFGANLKKVKAQGLESLKRALSLYVKQGRSIPRARAAHDPALVLQLPMMTEAKILLWNTMCEEGVNRAELARRMGCTRVAASRLVDFLGVSKIGTVERALELLGRRLTLVLEGAQKP
ncbi:hypothetical protein [Pseudomonas zeae]|uniref:hypothetical protein n=1 Tax=Pseudomonas zeae TaxID=2745510 RepID=UPI0039E1B150